MPTAFLYVRVHAPAPLLLELAEFYGSHLGLRVAKPKAGGVAVEVGETALELLPVSGTPFYHFALLAPGNRFEALLDWEGRLAFVGEKARTLILCRAGHPWLPTGRPAEAHPVEVVLSGRPEGEVPLDAGGWVRRSATQESG